MLHNHSEIAFLRGGILFAAAGREFQRCRWLLGVLFGLRGRGLVPFLKIHNLGNKRILHMVHRRIQLVNLFLSSRTNISCKNTHLELGTGDLRRIDRRNEEPSFEDVDSRQGFLLNEQSIFNRSASFSAAALRDLKSSTRPRQPNVLIRSCKRFSESRSSA